jgi:hypothetical protein
MKRYWVRSTCQGFGFAVNANGLRDALEDARSLLERQQLSIGRKHMLLAVEVVDGEPKGRIETADGW